MVTTTVLSTDLAADVPLALARAAHAGTSHVPERRAEQERDDYVATLVADYAMLQRYAITDEKRVLLGDEFVRYRSGYRRRFLVYLGARARCLSPMITGPSRFPTARNQKRSASADQRLADLVDFRKRALSAITKKLTPELQPIMAGAPDAVERLKAEIAAGEAKQTRMKAANAAIRKHAKAGPDSQVAALVGLGLPEGVARELIKPDFCGRIGFADYELTNNSGNLRRLRARLESVTAAKAAPSTEAEGDGVRLEDYPADNRVRLFFDGKPEDAVRVALKSHGFRWAPSFGCWQAYRNPHSLAYAQQLLARTMSSETSP